MIDVLSIAQRRHCMSSVKNRNTAPEVKLRRALWTNGMRYRLKYKLPGRPDIVFLRAKLVIFVDGCFWHCCPEHGTIPHSNREFWLNKLHKNKSRDLEVNEILSNLGWNVIRFWEHDINFRLSECVEEIISFVKGYANK